MPCDAITLTSFCESSAGHARFDAAGDGDEEATRGTETGKREARGEGFEVNGDDGGEAGTVEGGVDRFTKGSNGLRRATDDERDGRVRR